MGAGAVCVGGAFRTPLALVSVRFAFSKPAAFAKNTPATSTKSNPTTDAMTIFCLPPEAAEAVCGANGIAVGDDNPMPVGLGVAVVA